MSSDGDFNMDSMNDALWPTRPAEAHNPFADRQDSVASLSHISPTVEFLEGCVDLDVYRQLLAEDNDDGAEEPQYNYTQLDDPKKEQLIQTQRAYWDELEHNHYQEERPLHNNYNENYGGHFSVKTEPEEEFMESATASPVPSTSRALPRNGNRKIDHAKALEEYKPQTQARKYHLKKETEKVDPSYKLKRARNNDAVRRSRTKAKEQQQKIFDDYDNMKKRLAAVEEENKNLRARLARAEGRR